MNGLRKVRAGGQEIAYRSEGAEDAPAVLLVHAVLTDHTAWDGLAALLAPGYRVLRYDVRGHGGSSALPPPYTMEQLADDVPLLLDALGVGQVHLIGASMGGMIGQQVALRHPRRLLSLTVANTTAQQPAPAAWEERIAGARRSGMQVLAEPTMQRWFTEDFRRRSPQEVERIRQTVLGTSVEGFAGCASAIRDLAQLDALQQVTVPTLVVVGDQDQATPPELGRAIAQAIPGARLVSLPAAHQAAIEQPQAFFDAWRAFAEGLPH